MADQPIQPRPPELAEAVRLANAARVQLLAAIESTVVVDGSDLARQLNSACDQLEEAINDMTAVPEVEYLGQYCHASG